MRTRLITLLAAAVLFAAPPAAAEDKSDGCSRFLWPLETEMAWFAAPDPIPLDSGDTVATPPDHNAVSLKLRPAASTELPAKPTSTPKPEDAERFAGVVHFESIPEGHYQVALSDHGWVDVVQNGKALDATGHTGSPHCKKLRKSVRFEIAPGPFAVQVYGARADTIRFAIRPAAD